MAQLGALKWLLDDWSFKVTNFLIGSPPFDSNHQKPWKWRFIRFSLFSYALFQLKIKNKTLTASFWASCFFHYFFLNNLKRHSFGSSQTQIQHVSSYPSCYRISSFLYGKERHRKHYQNPQFLLPHAYTPLFLHISSSSRMLMTGHLISFLACFSIISVGFSSKKEGH